MSGSSPPSLAGSKSAIYTDIEFEEHYKFKSSVQKCLVAFLVLFFLTTVVFIILFAIVFVRYNEKVPTANICNTPDCAVAAATIAKKMNFSVDPCEDFSLYACGRFIEDTVFKEGRTRVATFSVVEDENRILMKGIITNDIRAGEPQYLSEMKKLYKSCTDEAKIEAIGLTPYSSNTQFVEDWPTLNPNWNESQFNLNDVITRYMEVYIEPLFMFYVAFDMKDSNRKILYIRDPALGLTKEYFARPRNDSVILAYEKYLADVAVELNASRAVAEEDAKNVVDLEIALSQIMVPREERRNSTLQYNPTNLTQLAITYPDIDIGKALKAAFGTANVTLADDEPVINLFPTYMANLSRVISNFDSRVIQNLFGFKYAFSVVSGLTRRMREIKLEFEKIFTGKKSESPRWEVCLDSTADSFWRGMSKEFVTRTFSEAAKNYMMVMIDNLEAEFREMIHESTWMGNNTKEQAYKKLKSIKRKIGYPDADFRKEDIEKKYENYTMSMDNYAENQLLVKKLENIEGLLLLRKPVDKNEWSMAPYVVNAYYSRANNEIAFPAGILQSPFFSQTFQDSMNYGAIGVVIGHEITHGFDDQGSQYDGSGNLNTWWHKQDRDNFVKRKQCIIDQNSNFYIKDINLNLNGINTQGESMADNGGLKESYRAYKKMAMTKGDIPLLPGLGLNHDQVFFLAYGQLWCEKITRDRLTNQVTNGVHPPGKYRIIGALQNSEDFARAYNCPRGSYMNPEKKCNVW